MNKMKNLRNLLLFLLIMGTGTTALSCSSNDDDEPKNEEMIVDNDPPQNCEGLSVSLQLLNSDSIAMKTFRQGENIIFRLTITNNRDSTVSLPLILDVIDDNAFTVYDSKGNKVGKPWESRSLWNPRPRLVENHSLTFEMSWLDGTAKPDLAFSDLGKRDPLPVGNYYTLFDINIFLNSDKKVTCRKDFTIIN